jgi:putative mRNA 3-end processing factor
VIDVLGSGAVVLGNRVVCDGFVFEHPFRVQTHIHDDHMDDFDSSKGFQNILLSSPTRDLLVAEFNADLPYRQNILELTYDRPYAFEDMSVTFSPNEHMLGSVQVVVEDGSSRLGYSGDFQWPIEHPIQVDELVVDSTYGSPDNCRHYSQEHVEEQLLAIVLATLKHDCVHVKAHRGTVQRAVQVLAGIVPMPVLASARLLREIEVFRRYGYAIDPILDAGSPEGRGAVEEGRYVRLYSKGDRFPVDQPSGLTISLSAYMTNPDDPWLWFSERSCRLAMSNHADFNGTIDYVRATGARRVVTDNTRGGHGVELANALAALGIDAQPSTNHWTRDWGA